MMKSTVLLALVLALSMSTSCLSCGTERWSVKVGTDSDAGNVDLSTYNSTTVAHLVGLEAPESLPADSRVAPTEMTQFQVKATLTEFKKEADEDYHLVLVSGSHTMIAEIPDPSCASGSPFLGGIKIARSQFDAQFSASGTMKHVNVSVTVTGVAFFDFIHGQTGVAPNGIEIHPVLDIQFLSLV